MTTPRESGRLKLMTAKSVNLRRAAEPDADLDQFVVQHHAEVAAKLAAARDELAGGQGQPLEPLEELLSAARSRSAQ